MLEFFRKLLFLIMAPFMTLLILFFSNTYGREGSPEGWYQELWDGNLIQWIIAVLLIPIYFPLKWLLEFLYPFWDELAE